MFINREAELAQLERLHASSHAELFVLYGRRRVGKTELLRAFCAGRPHLFFIATLSSDRDQLATFSQEIWRFTHREAPDGFTLPSWEAAFEALADLPGRPVVVLDEFTYLVGGNKAIPSILQKVWDQTLQHSRIFLILCGSYVGMMETEVLGYRSPLYGRRTGNVLLQPLGLPATATFFPAYSPLQQIEAWAILGGMPYYLRVFSDSMDLWTNVRTHILDPRGTLYHEPYLLLMAELREPRNYFSILRAIAQGRTRLNEIAQAAGVGNAPTTARYLDILQSMRVVTRIVPVTERHPEKSKKGMYQIVDPLFRFWFRYVHPNQGLLDLGLADGVMAQRVQPTFDDFVAHAFEQAAQMHLAALSQLGELPFMPERVGRWWDQGTEIDAVAVSDAEGALLLAECKWSVHPVGLSVLDDLKSKAERLSAAGRWSVVSFALFSKAGFTADLQEVARREGIRLVQAAELVTGS